MNDLFLGITILFTLCNNLLTVRDTDKKFELDRQPTSQMITNKNQNVDLAKLPDKKLMLEFAKEMYFDQKALGNKSTIDK